MRNTILSVVTAALVLSACGTNTQTAPTTPGAEIVQIEKHDDVEKKKRVCVRQITERKKVNGRYKSKKVCKKYGMKSVEVSPEWYRFKLRSGNRVWWTGRLNESTGESYQVGDQYP